MIANIKDLDEREGCGIQLKDGTIVVAVFYNGLYRDNGEYQWDWSNTGKIRYSGKAASGNLHHHVARQGRTWSKPNYHRYEGHAIH